MSDFVINVDWDFFAGCIFGFVVMWVRGLVVYRRKHNDKEAGRETD